MKIYQTHTVISPEKHCWVFCINISIINGQNTVPTLLDEVQRTKEYILRTLNLDFNISGLLDYEKKVDELKIIDLKARSRYEIKISDIFNDPRAFEGYTLFSPEYSTNTYLINNSGEIVHTWGSNYIQGLAVYLLENGNLIRSDLPGFNPTFPSGGISGRVEIFDWNGTLVWYFEYSTNQHCLHHDIEA